MHLRSPSQQGLERLQKGRRRFVAASCAFFAGSAIAIALLRPSPIEPLAVQPEPLLPGTGPLAPNHRLATVERIPLGTARGPEDVAMDASGRLYVGVEEGQILRLTVLADGTVRTETFARTGSRPLGLRFAADDTLLVAVAGRGLLAIERDGRIRELVTSVDGTPISVANHVDVASDGTVFFTDSSTRHPLEDYRLDLIEARPSGRLLALEPASGTARLLDSELFFPNGVALTAREDALLVAETGRSRVLRYPLVEGEPSRPEVLLAGLPGYPDNLSRDEHGDFWLALFTTRNQLLDRIHPFAWLKGRISALPRFLQPEAARYGFILRFDETGRILESYQDPEGGWAPNVTSVHLYDGALYLGNLEASWLAKLSLAESPKQSGEASRP